MKYELDLIDARNEGMEKDQPTSKQKNIKLTTKLLYNLGITKSAILAMPISCCLLTRTYKVFA